MSPLCESYLSAEQLDEMEPFYPLHVRVCGECLLVQLPAYVPAEEIFTEYAYFSAFSDSWVEHAHSYAEAIVRRLALSPSSLVVEVGSNDGYLLQHFVARGIPALGIEPAANVAKDAEGRGVETQVAFFGHQVAREVVAHRGHADLVIGNNVLAQVPDLNDFVAGLKAILGTAGVLTLEFPHLARLIEERQFDTIYHEHFSYFSLLSARRILAAHGLGVFDVEELPTHGGSLRVYAQHADDGLRPVEPSVAELIAREEKAGYGSLAGYSAFADQVEEVKRDLLGFLISAKQEGRRVVGYGAPGKGNTLLNYCGIRTDFVEFTVDRNPYKQGKFLPGTHIPIFAPEHIDQVKPDYILVLPWNLAEEITRQLSYARAWGARFVIPIPSVHVIH
jgi:SAM-dependent methyltransferase